MGGACLLRSHGPGSSVCLPFCAILCFTDLGQWAWLTDHPGRSGKPERSSHPPSRSQTTAVTAPPTPHPRLCSREEAQLLPRKHVCPRVTAACSPQPGDGNSRSGERGKQDAARPQEGVPLSRERSKALPHTTPGLSRGLRESRTPTGRVGESTDTKCPSWARRRLRRLSSSLGVMGQAGSS